MPSDAPHSANDRPVAGPLNQGGDAAAASGDEPLMGYECALPWLQQAWLATDTTLSPWHASAAG